MQRIKTALPENSYLDSDSESAFRVYLVTTSKRAVTTIAISTVALLLFFCVVDISQGELWFSHGNVSRYAASLIILLYLSINQRLTPKIQKQGWLAVSALAILLLGITFYDNALYFGRLGEGGPMLVSMAIVSIPIFHLLQKTLLWLLVISIVLFLKTCLSIDTGWTVFYLSLTTLLCMIFQQQQDKLLRSQFKAVRLEQQKAETDQLTGLLNRRSFEQRLQQKLAQLPAGQELSLGLLDIDFFKKYNDLYGHLDGDLVLVKAAKVLSSDPSLLVVRFGGEEFILVEQHDIGSAPSMLNIPQRFAELAIEHKSSPFGVVTVSIGIITLQQTGTLPSSSTLMQQADNLLYQAKNQGRNRAVHASFPSSS